MKNIHVLPTENYSDLVHSTNKYGGYFLSRHYSPMKDMGDSYQNIYITSDVEIKEGDWVFGGLDGIDIKKYGKYFAEDWKKIILTTDQDLIKDGVQAIDDEFLEWFVKNPSCEYVEFQKTFVTNSGLGYQEYAELNNDFEVLEVVARLPQTSYIVGEITKLEPYEYIQRHKIIIPQEEPNYNMKEEIIAEMERLEQEPKETIEEAAERLSTNRHSRSTSAWFLYKNGIIEGAKWKQETIEEIDYLQGFINQFEEGHKQQELSNDNWSVSQFLEWLQLNNFKIIK